jgi:hypothetical protein
MNRIVLRLMCDDRDEISFLFGPWGAVDRAEAIRQLEAGERTYTLQRQDGSRVELSAVGEGDGKRLRACDEGSDIVGLGAVRIGA